MKFLPSDINKDDIMLINIIYHNGKKDNNYCDSLDVIYKDLNTGEKYLHTIEEPKMEIFFTKEEFRDYEYNKSFLELSKTEMHTCKYKDLPFYIAKVAGPSYQNYIKRKIQEKDRQALRNIHKYVNVFGSDYDIENWYRIQWFLNYNNERPKPVTKTFLDIEVNTSKIGGFPRNGECPIDAVTLIDKETKSSFTFLLEMDDNPQIQEFKETVDDFIQDLHDTFDDTYGEYNFNIFMYKDERDLLIQLFKLINTLKRDFLLIWNIA